MYITLFLLALPTLLGLTTALHEHHYNDMRWDSRHTRRLLCPGRTVPGCCRLEANTKRMSCVGCT